MPQRYEAIRDSLKAKWMSTKEAKTHAAKIYNATRKPGEEPVTGKAEEKGKRG
jgi:hypothetical protein